MTRHEIVAPSRDDTVVRLASEAVGGPLGRRARLGSSWWTPLRVLLALTFLTCGVGLVQKDWCRDHAWGAPGVYTHACYSDIPPLYYGRGLADGEVPYIGQSEDRQVEYPVLTGAVMWLTAQLVPSSDVPTDRSRWYFGINAIGLALAADVAVGETMALAGRRPWDAAMFALAPGLALAGTINWDLYAVALLALGMLAWAREKPVAAGVLIGLAAATKFYPLFVLGPLLVLCLRAGRMREFGKTLAAAVITWLAVNVPVLIVAPSGWARFYVFSKARGADWGSVWYMFEHFNVPVLGNPQLSTLNKLTEVFFAVACAAIAVLALAAPRRPRLPQLCFLVLAAFLMTNKVWSPQYVVWLVPLAVLARPRLWPYLLWQAAEVAYFFGIWGYLIFVYSAEGYQVTGYQGISSGWYFATLAARFLAVGLLAAYVVRDIINPERDVVRALGTDDPAGGVLDHAEDRFRLRFNPGGRGLSIDRASANQIGG